MIDLGSIAGLHEHGHQLACHCVRCDRWALLDLAAMINAGHDERPLPITVRCQLCGESGQVQARPIMPAWTNSNGWMELR